VLDLGCGQRFPFALQCVSAGAYVTALDLDYVKPDPLHIAFVRTLKHNGLKRACKSLLRRLFFDRGYYKTLESSAQKPLRKKKSEINFIVEDPLTKKYSLPSNKFHLIASNAVIEHVTDVSVFAKEIKRMLRKGGFFYGIIHNFYSLSGGHDLEWAYPDENPSKNVPPWDHLLTDRLTSWPTLNRLLPEEYRKAFSDHLNVFLFEGRDVNHDKGGLEGERLLTSEQSIRLDKYSKELLLTRSWCIICQKK
jgi:SAM-dependent methyltransferase